MWYNGGMKTVLSYIKKLRLWLWHWIKRLWQYTVTFLVFLFISLYIILCFHFFREDPQLASATIALATLVLALGAFLAIRQSSNTQRRERKDRLLNEIIEWASNVAKSAISRQTIDVSELWKAKLEYKYHKSKGKYIDVIVSSSFKELSDPFKDANIKLDEAINFLERIFDGKGGNVLALKDYETGIVGSVEKILAEATKIKTRGIG